MGQILKSLSLLQQLYTLFKTLTQNLNTGLNDKVRTDLDLHKGSNLGMECMLLKGLTLS